MLKKILLFLFLVALLSAFTSEKRILWMAIGDSITDFDDDPEYSQNRCTRGYMSMVKERLPWVDFKNHGHSGWTTRQMVENWNELGVEKADVYSIFLGTNDWHRGHPVGSMADYRNKTGKGTILGAYRELVNNIRFLNPKAVIIVMTPMQRTDFVDVSDFRNLMHGGYKENKGQTVSQIVDSLNVMARSEGFRLVDLYNKSGMTMKNAVHFKRLKDPATGEYKNYKWPEYIGIPFDPEKDRCPYPADCINYTYDGLHPSDKGSKVIAEMLVKELKKL